MVRSRRTVNGEVDEEKHAVLDGGREGRAGAEATHVLDEGMRQGDVELPAQRLQDLELELGELIRLHLAVVNLLELRERRQLAVRKLGRDEEAGGGDHLDEALVGRRRLR